VNICFFYHSHIINGTTIVHSHFHDKDHEQSGTHSESELTLISALSAFQTIQPMLFFVGLTALFVLLAVYIPAVEQRVTQKLLTSIPLRAPPFYS